jgi:nucleoside phosphorylase
MPTLEPSEYQVGWICALPVEGSAAMAMLDERHDGPVSRSPSDHNSYTLGKIGKHNVVIACLPSGRTGTNDAAITAANLASCFQSVKIYLMVGIAGGIPSTENDIRLGDVVVSRPGSEGGGVIQYDRGKTLNAGEFVVTHTLDSTHPRLLSAFSTMQIRHDVDGNTFPRHLSKIPEGMKSKYKYPGEEQDKLFEENYKHVDGATCEKCDIEKLVKRDPRPSRDPLVHYGTVLSGNSLMVDAPTREQLRKQFKALCFEMEAAGLMSHFRCAVIRGIADYSDSHKNKHWQAYAALAAAAYTKELLGHIPPEHIPSSPPTPSPPFLLSPLAATPRDLDTPPSNEKTPGVHQHERLVGVSPNSFFVFNHFLLPPKGVALGRLVIDLQSPWEDFCPHIGEVASEDILTAQQPLIREMIESVKGTELYERLINRFSSVMSEEGSFFGSAVEKTCLLLNSGNWFQNRCADRSTREWLQTTIKHEMSVYMTVGIHMVPRSSLRSHDLREQLQNVELSPHGDLKSSNEEPLIIAVQYRKVQFDWPSKPAVDSAFLEVTCNRWEVYNGLRNSEDDGEIIEATLKDTIVKEDVTGQGDIFVVGGQVIVL